MGRELPVSLGTSGNLLGAALKTWDLVTWRQAESVAFDEVCIRFTIERDYFFPTLEKVKTELFSLTSRSGISDENFASQACNQPVSLFGQRRCDASMIRLERRKGNVPIQMIHPILDSQPELKPIDEQPNHKRVHCHGFGKATGFSHQAFDSGS